DAHNDCRANAASEGRLQAEGATHDECQCLRHAFEVDAYDGQGHGNVGESHDGYEDIGDAGDTANTAEDDHRHDDRQGYPADVGRHAEGVVHRTGHGVGLQRIEAEAEGDQQQNREQHRHPTLAQAMQDVEGRTTPVGAVRLAALVELRQGAFEIAGGHSDQRHHPHPEHRAWSAEHDGYGDAGDVARAHAARDAEHQGLKGAELARLAFEGLAEDAEHAAEVAQLDETGADGEVQTQADQHHDQQFARDKIIENIEHGGSASLVVLVKMPFAGVRQMVRQGSLLFNFADRCELARIEAKIASIASPKNRMSDILGSKLKLLCSHYRSIAEVCRKLVINRGQFNKYLSGESRPTAHNLKRICYFFGVEAYELGLPSEQFAQLIGIRGDADQRTANDPLS